MSNQAQCRLIRSGETYDGKQGFSYLEGISAQSVGAQGLCMHLLTIPPGGRAKAHLRSAHETAIYVLSGAAGMWQGNRLQHCLRVGAGDMLYIPAGEPHLPFNSGPEPVVAVIARTDPNEQESVTLLPELDALVPH
ncbi:cupin domain-containing protein [Paracoccus angustae]|uniref:Cupin domain-containing protein n=1 Tax=Paracoccus angustae TaxID=1671480 RepID=A0ABV7U8A7_9RHOB